jgi:glycosyltransferase involved in cell wall biosynthesis
VNSISGWGIFGLNLALHWANATDLRPVFGQVPTELVHVDPLRAAKLSRVLSESVGAARALKSGGGTITVEGIAIHALGNALRWVSGISPQRIKARSSLAAVFFEDSELDAEACARAGQFQLIITGSSWNAKVLRAAGIGHVTCVLQGIDPTLFHPAPASGLFGDRFLVFSGGKLEPRKGQDLVLEAFKTFAVRHSEAILVTAWHSPWPKLASAVGRDRGFHPVQHDEKGRVEVVRWAVDNGLKESQILDLGQLPNMVLPIVLREVNAALFMNRAEGGTNLVAMECMACGVPTILSANTGHLDLLRDGAAIPLKHQGLPKPPEGTRGIEGWGESDVEEAVEALEAIYSDRARAAETGRCGAKLLAGTSWGRQTSLLKEAIRPFLAGSHA